jgi:hypothetical protein
LHAGTFRPAHNQKRMIRSILLACLLPGLAACNSARDQAYVPAGPPRVVLDVRASPPQARVGERVELHVQRHYQGIWKEVARSSLKDGQCWQRQPPPAYEKEVADRLQWVAIPPEDVRFSTRHRSDHAQVVMFSRPGVYILQPRSSVWCGGGREAIGPSVTVAVR